MPRLSASLAALLLILAIGCDEDIPSSSASPSGAAMSTGFNGSFWTSVNGQQSVSKLTESNGEVRGNVDRATFTAKVSGNSAKGEIKDPDSGASVGTIDLALAGNKLTIQIVLKDPQSGETLSVPAIEYTRGEPPAVDAQNDQRLVGRWRHTWAKGEGGVSVAVDEWLYINADGTIQEGPSKAAGGSADVGIESSGSQPGPMMKWRTENKTLHVKQKDGDPWTVIGRYDITAENMMITYQNGSKKVYDRQ